MSDVCATVGGDQKAFVSSVFRFPNSTQIDGRHHAPNTLTIVRVIMPTLSRVGLDKDNTLQVAVELSLSSGASAVQFPFLYAPAIRLVSAMFSEVRAKTPGHSRP